MRFKIIHKKVQLYDADGKTFFLPDAEFYETNDKAQIEALKKSVSAAPVKGE